MKPITLILDKITYKIFPNGKVISSIKYLGSTYSKSMPFESLPKDIIDKVPADYLPRHFKVLELLRLGEPLTTKEVAERVGCNIRCANRSLTRLSNLGLVKKVWVAV